MELYRTYPYDITVVAVVRYWYKFINLIGGLCHTQKYFTCGTAASITMAGNLAVSGQAKYHRS